MSRSGMRGDSRRRQRQGTRGFRRCPPPATFEFVELRKGTRCVPAVEVAAGSQSVVDEIPDDVDRAALAGWLAAQGLAQIRRRGGSR
jgi:hypothetical protein